jgi:hypothetical protein
VSSILSLLVLRGLTIDVVGGTFFFPSQSDLNCLALGFRVWSNVSRSPSRFIVGFSLLVIYITPLNS